jgi:hypothetical protein
VCLELELFSTTKVHHEEIFTTTVYEHGAFPIIIALST